MRPEPVQTDNIFCCRKFRTIETENANRFSQWYVLVEKNNNRTRDTKWLRVLRTSRKRRTAWRLPRTTCWRRSPTMTMGDASATPSPRAGVRARRRKRTCRPPEVVTSSIRCSAYRELSLLLGWVKVHEERYIRERRWPSLWFSAALTPASRRCMNHLQASVVDDCPDVKPQLYGRSPVGNGWHLNLKPPLYGPSPVRRGWRLVKFDAAIIWTIVRPAVLTIA